MLSAIAIRILALLCTPTDGLTVHSAASDRIEKFAKRTFDLPRESVIAAVDSKGAVLLYLTENGRVTASDVARSAGIKLSDATRDLNLLASYTDGNLEVSKEGDIVYEFGPNVRTSLASRSVGLRARDAFQAVWPVLFYLTKISFGVAIFVSLAVVYGAIGVILSSSSSSDDDGRSTRRGGDRGFGGSSGFSSYTNGGYYDQRGPSVFIDFNPFGNIFNAFSYRPYGYYAPIVDDTDDLRFKENNTNLTISQYGEGERMGFLESVFSYVFGDGDPNRRRKEESLRAAARLIRDNYGVVTAEQLAPLLSPEQPPPDGSSDSIYVDESFVLDVLVTDRGELVYVFPDLSITAQVAESYDNDDGGSEDGAFDELLRITGQQSRGETSNLHSPSSPKILPEEAIPFSLASDTNKFLSGALGVINLVGAMYFAIKTIIIASYPVHMNSIENDGLSSELTILGNIATGSKSSVQSRPTVVFGDEGSIPLFADLCAWVQRDSPHPLLDQHSKEQRYRSKKLLSYTMGRTTARSKCEEKNSFRSAISAERKGIIATPSKPIVITKEKIGYSTSRDLDEQEFDDDERRQFQAFDAKMDNNDGRSSTKEDVRTSCKKEQI
eukprot:jgi/Bigna1/85078/estExt_fgenesh1_pg.C_20114